MTDGKNERTAAQILRDGVADIEELQRQKDVIAEKIKSKKGDMKSEGFVPKAVNQILKDRKATPEQRKSWNALMATYRAAMGMLDGDDLPNSARDAFNKPPPPADGDDAEQGDEAEDHGAADEGAAPPAAPEIHPEDIDLAREAGALAAEEGKKVTDNPYPAGDPRRAAWDEGWCGKTGGNGMGIPPAFQRTTPKKKKKGDSP